MKLPFNRKIPAVTAIVAASLTLSIPAAHADLRVNIFDDPSSGSLKVTVIGKLDTLPTPLSPPHPDLFSCGVDGLLSNTAICTGPNHTENLNLYEIEGNVTYMKVLPPGLSNADSVSGLTFMLLTEDHPYPSNVTGILDGYATGTPYFSTATFNGISLSSIGLSRGLVGTWNLIGTTEKITVLAEPVPGPLPFAGAASAYALSRRLRSRIRSRQAG
jgi:hypothetical protein